MLTLVVFLTISILIQQGTGINLTYIVTKEGDNLQPSCIAEEVERYSAIGWVFPLPKIQANLPNITTKFLPNIHNDFNCKFGKDDKCNKIWAIKNWQIDENSTRTYDLIADRRWEDFPTIFTASSVKEFADRVEIPQVFRAGFSIRADSGAELLICEGWNPHNYPCYHLNISSTQILLRKYSALPKNISLTDPFLDSYKAFSNILSGDEWRNFVLSIDDKGVLSLIDASLNRTVIQYQDKDVVKPLYLLPRSVHPALWKFHQNNFMYSKTAQISRLGPILATPSKDLCVSLFVSTCPNCAMDFIVMNGDQRKILKQVDPTKELEWQMVKLKDENVLSDKLTIFIQTKFADPTLNQSDGFWAIDDVRVCHENEVKVTFLKLKDGVEVTDDAADAISCQIVQHPKWRPRKLSYSKIKDFPKIEAVANPTSLNLTWTQEDPNNQINYFISYEANDLCTDDLVNLRRIKSNGFLMTKQNEIVVDKLIPYTKYNVTFSSMLHEKEKKLFVTTQESELPTPEEMPNRVQIQVTDSKAYVSWDKISCTAIYGHIIYSMKLINLQTNSTKDLNIQTENTVEINELDPFTPYSLKIQTARNFENIQSNRNTIDMNINFTTQAGVAPAVKNLETYSIDKNSVSMRYDLPKSPRGIPSYMQVARCNPIFFKKCKTTLLPIQRCHLWPKKYCLEMGGLMPAQRHTFKISIRNEHTHIFGDEVVIDAYTRDQVPAPPTNVTYKIVDCKEALDYCHLNISWLHPYDQNGTIMAFDIVLNATDNNETSKNIREVLQVFNKTYLPQYEYQIKFIPYSAHYELFIRSVDEKLKSNFVNIHVKTADIGDHIDQSPTLVGKSDDSLIFRLPEVDPRLKSYTLTVVVQDFNKTKTIPTAFIEKNRKAADHLCHNFGETWIAEAVEVANKNSTQDITVGKKDKPLRPDTQYCITFIVTNKYRDSEHDVVYYEKLQTPKKPISVVEAGQYKQLYGLLLLLLLVPVGFFLYRILKKRRRPKPKPQNPKENVYESLPFEECEENCVSNETYDHLLHK